MVKGKLKQRGYKRDVFDAFIDSELVKTVKARSIDSETHARQF